MLGKCTAQLSQTGCLTAKNIGAGRVLLRPRNLRHGVRRRLEAVQPLRQAENQRFHRMWTECDVGHTTAQNMFLPPLP